MDALLWHWHTTPLAVPCARPALPAAAPKHCMNLFDLPQCGSLLHTGAVASGRPCLLPPLFMAVCPSGCVHPGCRCHEHGSHAGPAVPGGQCVPNSPCTHDCCSLPTPFAGLLTVVCKMQLCRCVSEVHVLVSDALSSGPSHIQHLLLGWPAPESAADVALSHSCSLTTLHTNHITDSTQSVMVGPEPLRSAACAAAHPEPFILHKMSQTS